MSSYAPELPQSDVVSTGMSFEDFLRFSAEGHYEWIDGDVHEMASIELTHVLLSAYLRRLFDTYFAFNPIATLLFDPFVMRLTTLRRGRAPDLFIVMNDSDSVLHHNYLEGPADICIEIVSPGSMSVDHGEKYEEYERGGVPEYWILDFIHEESRFYRMNEQKRYVRVQEDKDGYYTTPRLPNFKLHVPTLWKKNLPNAREVMETVKAMWENNDSSQHKETDEE